MAVTVRKIDKCSSVCWFRSSCRCDRGKLAEKSWKVDILERASIKLKKKLLFQELLFNEVCPISRPTSLACGRDRERSTNETIHSTENVPMWKGTDDDKNRSNFGLKHRHLIWVDGLICLGILNVMSMVLKVPGRRADHEIDIFFKGNVHSEAKFALNWRLFEMKILSFISQNPTRLPRILSPCKCSPKIALRSIWLLKFSRRNLFFVNYKNGCFYCFDIVTAYLLWRQ